MLKFKVRNYKQNHFVPTKEKIKKLAPKTVCTSAVKYVSGYGFVLLEDQFTNVFIPINTVNCYSLWKHRK